MHIFHTIQMNEVSNMPLLYMFYLNIDDSRDLGNFDRPFSYLTNSAFPLLSVFHLIVGSNWTKVCTVHGRVRVSMSIWVNSWCEFFTFPLTQLFPLGWKSWLIYQIIVGNLVFHQIIVSINFFIVTQIKFFWYLLFQTQIKFFIGKIVSIAKTFEPFNIPIELGVDFTSDELLTSISTNHFVLIQFIFDKRR